MVAELSVYAVNNFEWYIASSLEEAIEVAMQLSGLPRDEAADEETAHKLTDADLDRWKFVDESGEVEINRTFREELARRVATDPKPQFFASTEY